MSRATANINRLPPSEFSPWLWPTECAHRKSATIQAPRCTTERNEEVFDGHAGKSRERVARVIRNRAGEGGNRTLREEGTGQGGTVRRKGSRRCCTFVGVQFRVKTLSRLQIYSGRRRLENFKETRMGCLLLSRPARESIDPLFTSTNSRLLTQLVGAFYRLINIIIISQISLLPRAS